MCVAEKPVGPAAEPLGTLLASLIRFVVKLSAVQDRLGKEHPQGYLEKGVFPTTLQDFLRLFQTKHVK